MKDSKLTASWMVSFCKAPNRRTQLVERTRKLGLKVDIFGKCGNSSLPAGCQRLAATRNNCAAEIHKKYFFYIAFENSNCVDYVTEKYFNALRFFFSVPIVIKRSIYTDLGFPPKSFIAVDDFGSLREMVAYLERLKGNRTEYLSYHEWRDNYEFVKESDDIGLCSLCRRLRSPQRETKTYPNFQKWFNQAGCDNSYAFKYL